MFAISSSVIGPEDLDNLAAFTTSMGLTMPILIDSDAQLYDDYSINDPDAFSPYPREYIIDSSGTVIYTSSNIDIVAMQEVLDQQLGQ
jgi:peroxiredoxin